MKDLRKYYRIRGAAEEIYAALTNPFSITLWTGAEAIMTEEEGSEFSLFDGDISGINLRFEKNRLIKQEWFFGEQEDKSIVTITLRTEKHFTRIELHHTNIPDKVFEEMEHGWNTSYFGSLKEFFEL